MADGAKLIGSAQLRRGSGALQHGSMPLWTDAVLFKQVFDVAPALPTLPFSLPPAALIETVMQALIAAARHCFAADLQVQPLTEAEWESVLKEVRGEG